MANSPNEFEEEFMEESEKKKGMSTPVFIIAVAVLLGLIALFAVLIISRRSGGTENSANQASEVDIQVDAPSAEATQFSSVYGNVMIAVPDGYEQVPDEQLSQMVSYAGDDVTPLSAFVSEDKTKLIGVLNAGSDKAPGTCSMAYLLEAAFMTKLSEMGATEDDLKAYSGMQDIYEDIYKISEEETNLKTKDGADVRKFVVSINLSKIFDDKTFTADFQTFYLVPVDNGYLLLNGASSEESVKTNDDKDAIDVALAGLASGPNYYNLSADEIYEKLRTSASSLNADEVKESLKEIGQRCSDLDADMQSTVAGMSVGKK